MKWRCLEMYRNFICYRGGSSAGILFAEDIYKRAKEEEKTIGRTYYSLYKEDGSEIRNFLTDPKDYLCEVENIVLLLTKDFLEGFIVDGQPNPNSVTRIEIDEALKNPKMKFIPVVFPDFSWEGTINGMVNKEILSRLWGEESMRRIVGSPPIQFVFQYKKQVVEQILYDLDPTGTIATREVAGVKIDPTFKLESTPSVIPKSVFCGREKELQEIKDIFDSGERILFLQGIGGIGKTEIAKQYAKRNKSQYDTVIYATYNNTIVELVSSQVSFKIEPMFIRKVQEDGTQESDISFFNRKLNLIREITNERTLIIIDNFDVMDDEHFSDLLDANYKLLITTRCDYSRLYPTIKIEPLDSIEQLKNVFLQNYDGYVVDEDDEHLAELIELINRHTYTIELIAQHMENSGQTTEEMIEMLKHEGIVSLNEEVRSTVNRSLVAYENLLKMFKVFNLDDEEKRVLQYLGLMPLSGVDVRDFKNWLNLTSLKVIKNLENRSWIVIGSNGVALHPIIRDVIRYELPLKAEDAQDFFNSFNETIKEEKSWHFPINTKCYYADIAAEIINVFNVIVDETAELYRNIAILFSFSVKPARAVELYSDLFKYYASKEGELSFKCGYCAFQAGWTNLFNFHLPNALQNAKEWFDRSYKILTCVQLNTPDEYAAYGHLLSHLCRTYLIMYEENKDESLLEKALDFGNQTVVNAEAHLNKGSPYYSRLAVAYMQLAEVYIASKGYEKALSLLNDAYNIMFSLFGDDDPDTLNVSSRQSMVLYNMGRFSEALAIGQKNLDTYTKFYGEVNYLRFEQLAIVLKCCVKLEYFDQVKTLKESVAKIGAQLLPDDSKQLQELLSL